MLDQGAPAGPRQFSCKFLYKVALDGSCEMLTCISTAQARTKCVSAFWADTVVRQVCFKFLDKVALVKCLYKVALVKCGPRLWGAATCL